jgi:pseudaminic acid cytidylyltransferase
VRLCVIPARGGSKRIHRKNIVDFYGKPIIAWSIEAAIESACFDRIVVSSDDNEILEVAKKYGAEVPFIRPLDLSGDYIGTTPVIAHAIDWHLLRGQVAETVCCIYPTAPFVKADDLRRGLEILQTSGADYAFSVTKYDFPIQRAIRITKNQKVEMFYPEYFDTRSQDLEEAWHDAGQFYWGKASAWCDQKPIFGNASPVYIPRDRVQDIDSPEDLARARLIFRLLGSCE